MEAELQLQALNKLQTTALVGELRSSDSSRRSSNTNNNNCTDTTTAVTTEASATATSSHSRRHSSADAVGSAAVTGSVPLGPLDFVQRLKELAAKEAVSSTILVSSTITSNTTLKFSPENFNHSVSPRKRAELSSLCTAAAQGARGGCAAVSDAAVTDTAVSGLKKRLRKRRKLKPLSSETATAVTVDDYGDAPTAQRKQQTAAKHAKRVAAAAAARRQAAAVAAAEAAAAAVVEQAASATRQRALYSNYFREVDRAALIATTTDTDAATGTTEHATVANSAGHSTGVATTGAVHAGSSGTAVEVTIETKARKSLNELVAPSPFLQSQMPELSRNGSYKCSSYSKSSNKKQRKGKKKKRSKHSKLAQSSTGDIATGAAVTDSVADGLINSSGEFVYPGGLQIPSLDDVDTGSIHSVSSDSSDEANYSSAISNDTDDDGLQHTPERHRAAVAQHSPMKGLLSLEEELPLLELADPSNSSSSIQQQQQQQCSVHDEQQCDDQHSECSTVTTAPVHHHQQQLQQLALHPTPPPPPELLQHIEVVPSQDIAAVAVEVVLSPQREQQQQQQHHAHQHFSDDDVAGKHHDASQHVHKSSGMIKASSSTSKVLASVTCSSTGTLKRRSISSRGSSTGVTLADLSIMAQRQSEVQARWRSKVAAFVAELDSNLYATDNPAAAAAAAQAQRAQQQALQKSKRQSSSVVAASAIDSHLLQLPPVAAAVKRAARQAAVEKKSAALRARIQFGPYHRDELVNVYTAFTSVADSSGRADMRALYKLRTLREHEGHRAQMQEALFSAQKDVTLALQLDDVLKRLFPLLRRFERQDFCTLTKLWERDTGEVQRAQAQFAEEIEAIDPQRLRDLRDLFDLYDADGSGTVTAAELVKALSVRASGTTTAAKGTNGGSVSSNSSGASGALPGREAAAVTKAEMLAIVNAVDTDGNSELSFEEFVQLFKDVF
jgi:EF-hand domain pair